jgi:outer membrane protein TolC
MRPHAMRAVALAAVLFASAAAAPSGEPAKEAPANAAGTLTLREALSRAGEDGDAVLAARLEAWAAAERVQAAEAERYWPRLDLIEQYVRSDDPGVITNYRAEQNKDMKLGRFDVEDYRTKAELSYVIFDGGQRAGWHRAAQAGFWAAMRNRESVRSRAIVAAGDAFLTAVYAERQRTVAREEVGRMEARLEMARSREKAGRDTAADVLLAEYRLERAKRNALAAGNSADGARERLGRLLGRSAGVSEQLAEDPEDPLSGAAALASAEAAERSALGASPELAQARAELAEREASLDAQRATRWPRLEVSASAYWDDENAGRLDDNERSYLLGAGLTWTAFDGGARRGRIAEARNRAEAAQVRARDAERRTRVESREAARACQEARAGAAVAAKKLAADQEVFNQTEKAHAAGRASFAELLKAQSDLADSRLAELQASFDRRRAELRLLEATGYWVTWQGDKK